MTMRTLTLLSVVVLGAFILPGSPVAWAGAATGPTPAMGGYMGTGYGSAATGVADSCGATAPAPAMGGYMGENTGYGSMAAGVSGSGCPGTVATSAGQGTALAGSAPEIAVQSAGEANAVASVLPRENGIVMIRLRDGSDLLVPATVNVPDSVREGSWINATVQQIEGKNIVTSLDVVSDPSARSQGQGGS
jgi:hypothetical protein